MGWELNGALEGVNEAAQDDLAGGQVGITLEKFLD